MYFIRFIRKNGFRIKFMGISINEYKNFRKKNKPTDILSFPFKKKVKISQQTFIGDIIISYNFINKPKSQKLKIFKIKLIKIFIHGFLHLLGFTHLKNKDYIKNAKPTNPIAYSKIMTGSIVSE